MMSVVSASSHFVPASRIPVRPSATSASAAYAAFTATDSGGLVVEDSGIPFYYLTAGFLWRAIDQTARSIGLKAAGITPLSGYLHQFFNKTDHAFDEIRAEFEGKGVLDVERGYLWANDPEPISQRPDSVFAVRGPAGEIAGWLFGSEGGKNTIQTPRPTFVCKNGHINYDPDSGQCIYCKEAIY
jgi:hypothetical protein